MVKKYVSEYGHSGEVEWKESDESYEVDGSELLAQRADVMRDKTTNEGLGSIEHGEETQELRQDIKGVGWVEPSTAKRKGEKVHVCPICGIKFVGRPNKKFCSPRCKKTSDMRSYRAKDLTKFKPHQGKSGEIYFKTEGAEQKITFVPAMYCDNLITAIDWLKKNYEGDKYVGDYIEQVKRAFEREMNEVNRK